MLTILKAKGAGKTTDCIAEANRTGAYLVVRDQDVAHAVAHLTDRFPVTYGELLNGGMRGSFVRNIVIDDADALLRYVLPYLKIDAISLTPSEAPADGQ